MGSANYQDGAFQSNNVDDELLARGLRARHQQVHQPERLLRRDRRADPAQPLWFYVSHRDSESGNFIPGFISLATGEQQEFYSKLQNPTGKFTWQVSQNNKFEAMAQVGRKWQPYRGASRFVPLEATQNQDSWSLIGPSFKWLSVLSPNLTFDASVQRGGYWWPDVPWTTDVRKNDQTTGTTYGAFLESDRTPRRWQYGGTMSYFTELLRQEPRVQDRLSRLVQHDRDRDDRLSEPAAVSLPRA